MLQTKLCVFNQLNPYLPFKQTWAGWGTDSSIVDEMSRWALIFKESQARGKKYVFFV